MHGGGGGGWEGRAAGGGAPGPRVPAPTPMSGPPAPRASALAYEGAPTTYVEALEEGRPLRVPRWGWGDVGLALLISIVVPVILVVAALSAGFARNGSVVILLSLTSPWIGFALYPLLATRAKGNGAVVDLGWTLRWIDLLWGALGGLAALLLGGIAAWLTQMVTGPFDSAAGEAISTAVVPSCVLLIFLI